MAQVRNFYQFNAALRNRVERLGEAIAEYRQSNARDEASVFNAVEYMQNFKALATEYAFVGSVFNRRNEECRISIKPSCINTANC
jgi:uncharacterized protein YkvS